MAAITHPLRPGFCLIFALILVGTLSLTRSAEACSCVLSPTNCSGLQQADAVFEGTVESIELVSPPPPPGTKVTKGAVWVGGKHHVVKLAGLRAWRGEASPLVVTSSSSASCGYPFQQGERYLIVAHRDALGRLSVSLCGQTRPIKAADGLINYLKWLESSSGTRVWGTVVKVTGDRSSAPVPGAVVTLNGPKEIIATTDSEGRFVVTGIALGAYSVSAAVPMSNTVAEAFWPKFELAEGATNACAELIFQVPAGGSVSGLVLDEHGQPLVRAFVTLLSDAQAANRSRGGGRGIETDDEGRYVFSEIPPGNYRVVMNDGGPEPIAPYERLLARSPAGATTFSLRDGESIALDPLVPQRLSPVKVQGTVRDSNGSPVAGIEIQPWVLLPDNERQLRWPRPISDAAGQFVLQLWMNQRYRVTAGREPSVLGEIEILANGEPISIVIRQR